MNITYEPGEARSALILTTHLLRLPRLVRVAGAALNAAPGAVADTTGLFRLRMTITGRTAVMPAALAAATLENMT